MFNFKDFKAQHNICLRQFFKKWMYIIAKCLILTINKLAQNHKSLDTHHQTISSYLMFCVFIVTLTAKLHPSHPPSKTHAHILFLQ